MDCQNRWEVHSDGALGPPIWQDGNVRKKRCVENAAGNQVKDRIGFFLPLAAGVLPVIILAFPRASEQSRENQPAKAHFMLAGGFR